jgi:hypothetical protein
MPQGTAYVRVVDYFYKPPEHSYFVRPASGGPIRELLFTEGKPAAVQAGAVVSVQGAPVALSDGASPVRCS